MLARQRVVILNRVSTATGVIAVVTGVSVVYGWWLRLPGLRAIHPRLAPMNPLTAVCFALAGTSLLLQQHRTRGWQVQAARVSAAVVVVIALATIVDTWTGRTIPWHRVLAIGAFESLFPARMPIPTALALLSLSTALITLDLEVRRVRVSELLAFAAILISFLALIAHAYGSFSLSETLAPRVLAFHSVLLLLMFAVAVIAARVDTGLAGIAVSDTAGGLTVRRLLPAAVAIPAVIGWISLEALRAGLAPLVVFAYFAIAIVLVFGLLIWFTAASVHALEIERATAREEVDALNAELEERVAERTTQLEAANKELESFSYSVSHDLRAPLRAIDGFSRVLLEDHDAQLNDEGRSHLKRVLDATARMSMLVDDLLSLARVSRGAMHREAVDMSAMAEAIAVELGRTDPGRMVDVQIQPGLSGDADTNLLRIVLANLLGNAWKFTARTAGATIGLDARVESGGETVYRVGDNGAGFDMAYAGKLFGAFQRLHSAKDFDGTGIGLATVQRIVHRHGGEVWAEGAVGRGASFYFTLASHAKHETRTSTSAMSVPG